MERASPQHLAILPVPGRGTFVYRNKVIFTVDLYLIQQYDGYMKKVGEIGLSSETIEEDNGIETENTSQNVGDNLVTQHGETLVKLRRDKRTQKTRLTKFKHRLQRLCIIKAESSEIESCIGKIWDVLEETKTVMDEMSMLFLKMSLAQSHE